LLVSLVSIISLACLALASYNAATYDGGDLIINSSSLTNLNISINNSESLKTNNISQVNITLPSEASCIFEESSNGTDSSVSSIFANNSNILS
jgi:hypothetical protein